MPVTKRRVTVFNQFGFRESDASGKHSIGNCPFCGKRGHFFINNESKNKTWDCKRCGRGGGFKRFLEEMVTLCFENLQKDKAAAKRLQQHRGISLRTIERFSIGYHPQTEQYILPSFTIDGKGILTAKLYDFKNMRNISGGTAAMYGMWDAERLKNASDIVLCEGEWDAMVMSEIIDRTKVTGTAVLGVPGAGVFKGDALPLCQDRNVYLIYDNDEAGERGMEKASAALGPIARKIMRVKWPESFTEGFDLRDFYRQNKNNAIRTWEQVMGFMERVEVTGSGGPSPAVAEIVDVGDPVPCGKVYKSFKKWLHIPDTTLLDVMFGTLLANRLPGDPLWMFIVAPPGATKTEPLLGLSGAARIEMISTLTPHTLISGANFGGGGDPSLIPRLDKKVLIVKDFTSVLNLPHVERDEIFGILRDAYDGECSKPFGNGIFRRYRSKFGILAAVTPAIELFTESHAALGERFLRWRNYIPSNSKIRRVYVEKALSNSTKEDNMRGDLAEIARDVVKAKYEVVPVVPAGMRSRVVSLALLVSMLRGTVVRDKYTRDITHHSYTELGTRVSKQLDKLIRGVAMFRGEEIATEHEYKIALNVAHSSVPYRLNSSVRFMRKRKEKTVTTAELSEGVKLPVTTCKTVLENLSMLGAVETVQGKRAYKFTKDMNELMDNVGW